MPADDTALPERFDVDFALKAARIGIWELDPITGQLNWDERCRQLFGVATDNHISYQQATQYIHPADAARVAAATEWAMNPTSGGGYDLTYRTIGADDGRQRRVRFTGQAYFNQVGELARFAGIAQAVPGEADPQPAEASEARFRSLIEQAPMAVGLLRGRQLIIEVGNQRILELWGKDQSIINRPLMEALPELQGQEFPQLLERVYQTGEPHYGNGVVARLIRGGVLEEAYFDFVYSPLSNTTEGITGVMVLANEVTRQVVARQALEANEARLRTLINEAPVATCLLVGRNLTIELANEVMIGYWGKDSSVIGQPLAEAVPELRGQPFLSILDEVYTTGQPYRASQDAAALVVDGRLGTYYFNFTYKPLFDSQGQVYAILDMAIDVTEVVKARQQMAEAEEALRDAIELAELATWRLNPLTNTLTYSDRLKDWLGCQTDESGLDNLTRSIPAGDRERIELALVQSMGPEGDGAFNEEFPVENSGTGVRRIIHAQARTYFDPQGKPAHLMGTARDITSQRQQQRALEQQVLARTHERWHLSAWQDAILQHAGQAIISTDSEGVVRMANPAAEKLVGYRPGELIGQVAQVEASTPDSPFPTLSYGPQRTLTPTSGLFETALETVGYFYAECVLLDKDHQRIPVLLAASVLKDEAGHVTGIVGMATDISALKAAEENLHQKNRALNTFFEGALDMHWIGDRWGSLSKTNQAFQTALGYSETELMAIPFWQLVGAEQQLVCQNQLAGALQQPVRRQINRFRKKDGSYRMVEWNAIGIDNLVYGSARDITERQEAETQLRDLNQRLQLATQAVGQGIWEQDLEKGHLYWDDRLCEVIGIQPGRADWSFEEFIRMMHPEDRALFLESVQQVTRLGSSEVRFFNVCRMIKPDGTIIYMETHGQVVKNQQGDPIRAIGVAWDVTPRKQAEAALQESEQRFREIAENVDEVFWIHAVEPFELLYINPAYERMFGVDASRRPMSEVSFGETILAEDRAWVMAEFDHYRHGQEVTLQFRVQGTHPAIRWVQIRTFIMRDAAGVPVRYIGIGNDITSQKEEEMVLQQSLAREQDLNKLKSQFVATASHEFRTPLTTIQSSADLIKLYLDKPQETAKPLIEKHLGAIHQQIQAIDELLTDLLTIGTIEAGKVAFHPHWVEVPALCQQVIASHFSHQSDGRMVRLSLEGVPGSTLLDTKLMGHVLVNLLSNAFKFSRADPRLVIGFRANQVVIQVIDTGIGIPASDVSALFQTFFRARNTTAIQGTGLGLVIARQYVELHGGSLTVESEEGQGTTFTIVLPTILRS